MAEQGVRIRIISESVGKGFKDANKALDKLKKAVGALGLSAAAAAIVSGAGAGAGAGASTLFPGAGAAILFYASVNFLERTTLRKSWGSVE